MKFSGDKVRQLIPWLLTLGFIYGVWFFGFGYVRYVVAERQLAKNRWPIEFPMHLIGGSYTPSRANEAVKFCEEELRKQSLDPEELEILEAKREGIGKTEFRLSGEAEGINQYGTRVHADFQIEVTSRRNQTSWGGQIIPRARERQPFYVLRCLLADSGQSRIWRGSSAGLPEPFRQQPSSARRSELNQSRAPYQIGLDGARRIYSSDLER